MPDYYKLFWIPNGFDPKDESKTDSYSQVSLRIAARRYHSLREAGHPVAFWIPRSVVRSRRSSILLWETMYTDVRKLGVLRIRVTPMETTGSPTDGLAIAQCLKNGLRSHTEIFVSTQEVADYVRVMYPAVAWWKEGMDLAYTICSPNMSGGWRSRCVYQILQIVTWIAARTNITFLCWYRVLNFFYRLRTRGFTRTVR